jgi:kumamolisin
MSLSSRPQSSPLAGSFRKHPANSVPVGAPTADEIIELKRVLRRRQPEAGFTRLHAANKPLTREEHEALAGADPKDIESVEALISSRHLTVAWVHPHSRSIGVRGPLSRLAELFGASLEIRRTGTKLFRSRRGYLQVPSELDGIVTGVFGFDTRPFARASRKFRVQSNPEGTFTPKQVAQAYHFPSATGKGETIALIELGGGFRYSDLHHYLAKSRRR